MENEMPKEIWAGTTLPDKVAGGWFKTVKHSTGYDEVIQYTRTDTIQALKDRIEAQEKVIEDLRAELQRYALDEITRLGQECDLPTQTDKEG